MLNRKWRSSATIHRLLLSRDRLPLRFVSDSRRLPSVEKGQVLCEGSRLALRWVHQKAKYIDRLHSWTCTLFRSQFISASFFFLPCRESSTQSSGPKNTATGLFPLLVAGNFLSLFFFVQTPLHQDRKSRSVGLADYKKLDSRLLLRLFILSFIFSISSPAVCVCVCVVAWCSELWRPAAPCCSKKKNKTDCVFAFHEPKGPTAISVETC